MADLEELIDRHLDNIEINFDPQSDTYYIIIFYIRNNDDDNGMRYDIIGPLSLYDVSHNSTAIYEFMKESLQDIGLCKIRIVKGSPLFTNHRLVIYPTVSVYVEVMKQLIE